MGPAFKSSRRNLHQHRGGSCGTATSFTRATIDLVIRDLFELPVCWRQASHLKRFAARKAARVFQPRTGAQGLEITTRKAAGGTSAHFGAANLVRLALLLTHPRFRSRFPYLRAPKKRPSAPSPVLLIEASSPWAWWIKPTRRRGSQVRFLLLPEVRGAWHVP